jgi:hypothetical protein
MTASACWVIGSSPSFCVATLVPACVWVWMQQAASGRAMCTAL